jgi:hypothetical protein
MASGNLQHHPQRDVMGNYFGSCLAVVAVGCSLLAPASSAEAAETSGQYARIAFLRPFDGDTVDFEAGYLRHLEWHRRNGDAWTWLGWTIWAGDRQRWFVYATFGHSAENLGNPVNPAADEADNVSNVTPHAQFSGNGLYEFLPALSRGDGVPSALPRTEMTTVDLHPGTGKRFEAALARQQARQTDETLWFRLVAGGSTPRYVRLRPRPGLRELLEARDETALPEETSGLIATVNVEILSFRKEMSYNFVNEVGGS